MRFDRWDRKWCAKQDEPERFARGARARNRQHRPAAQQAALVVEFRPQCSARRVALGCVFQ